ncbi:MAG: radical SAM protein [Candidatus Coatesbacteria bacterium]|nr:radical SAM protein [Candidatus Coatesbacteria bacterium]
MRILFLNPPFFKNYCRPQRSPGVNPGGTQYYPLYLCYAAGYAEKNGHEVKVLDCPARHQEIDVPLKVVQEWKPDLLVVESSTPSVYNDIDVVRRLKAVKPDLYSVLVGTHVTAVPEETMNIDNTLDGILRFEYELTVAELAQVLEDKGDISTVKGLTYRNSEGKIMHNEDRELETNLEKFPFVSYQYKKHLVHSDYRYAHSRHPILTLITTRGCPFQCIQCVYPQTFAGHKVRLRDPEAIVDEIIWAWNNFFLRDIMFEDDTFIALKSHTIKICEEILRRNFKFSFSANARADADEETISILKKAGCRLLCVGFESGNQDILDRMKKSLKLEKAYKFVQYTKKHGILVRGCYMIGLPGETRETMKETLDFAIKLNTDTAQFFPVMLYPGTEFYEWARKEGYLKTHDYRDWIDREGYYRTHLSYPDLPNEEMVSFCHSARKAFYLRPEYIAHQIWWTIKHPGELTRNMDYAKIFFKFFKRSKPKGKATDVLEEKKC